MAIVWKACRIYRIVFDFQRHVTRCVTDDKAIDAIGNAGAACISNRCLQAEGLYLVQVAAQFALKFNGGDFRIAVTHGANRNVQCR